LSNDEFGTQDDWNVMLALEDDLIKNMKRDGVAEVDGTETGHGEAVLYLYGPDVRKLWSSVHRRARPPALFDRPLQCWGQADRVLRHSS
jgi:hypothetical protein